MILAHPRVSVIMAVYNGARYVRQAIDSILNQTFDNFEFVIVEDGSTDETTDILAGYKDPRIVLVSNKSNIGLTRSLNRGITVSVGELLARQDADDRSLPDRLAKQVAYLDTHPSVGLVGCGNRWIDGTDRFIKEWQPPCDPAELQQLLLWSVPFLHGTFMFRRTALEDVGGGYDEDVPVAQDCHLLLHMSDRWDLANVEGILYVHRRHDDTVTAKHRGDQDYYLQLAQRNAIDRRLVYLRGRLGLARASTPEWVTSADHRWLAQRAVWWSAGTRACNRGLALQFLLLAVLLDPAMPEIWQYLKSVAGRKIRWIGSKLAAQRQVGA